MIDGTLFLPAPPGIPCGAGLRRAVINVNTGKVLYSELPGPCPDTADWVVPMVCPSCGNQTEAPYCQMHTTAAVYGDVACIFCPDSTAEVACAAHAS
jgi:hypothetical protein